MKKYYKYHDSFMKIFFFEDVQHLKMHILYRNNINLFSKLYNYIRNYNIMKLFLILF